MPSIKPVPNNGTPIQTDITDQKKVKVKRVPINQEMKDAIDAIGQELIQALTEYQEAKKNRLLAELEED